MTLLATLIAAAAGIGVPVNVHCASEAQTVAYMTTWHRPTPQAWSFMDTKQVYLREWLCRAIRKRTTDCSYAVGIFAHELGHVARQTYSERAAESFRKANQRKLGRFIRC